MTVDKNQEPTNDGHTHPAEPRFEWQRKLLSFRYTDEQWEKIVAELPSNVEIENDEIRAELQQICGILRVFPLPTAETKALANKRLRNCRNLAKRARRLLDEWPHELTVTLDPVDSTVIPEPLFVELQILVDRLEERVPTRKKGPNQSLRNIIIKGFLEIWIMLGGDLKTSISSDSGHATGPLVRFLMAAANPVLEKQLTSNAARALVRAYKNDPSAF